MALRLTKQTCVQSNLVNEESAPPAKKIIISRQFRKLTIYMFRYYLKLPMCIELGHIFKRVKKTPLYVDQSFNLSLGFSLFTPE